jgi:hypothetical protein
MKKRLPKDNELPAYEAKKILCPLGLEVQKIPYNVFQMEADSA